MTPDLAPYMVLLNALADGRLSAEDFVTVYLTLFKRDPITRPDDVYQRLNDVFGAADGYYPDANPADPTEVTEVELKEIVAQALEDLKNLTGNSD